MDQQTMGEPSGKTIGRYVVQSLLGEGAMGSVFKAFDPVIKRVVAIKTIKLEQSRTEEDQREFMQRFFQEAQISGILNHPNIVSIYDVGEQNGMPYIAMEYVEGQNLSQIIHSSPRPTTPELAKYIMQVANALEFAHSKGIVHRDLKPGNIMVTPKGMAKIMDFGIAKMSGSHLTQTGVFLGTPSFASPEQIKEGHVDHRSDIFSLGILAHETLTGHTPFPGQSISAILYKIANEPPQPAPNLDDLPIDKARWKTVFDKVFQKEAANRYQHAAEFGQDLTKTLTITDTERARIGTVMGQIDMTVRDAFGIQKDIQRSEFEMAQAKPTPPVRPTTQKPKSKKGLLWVLISLFLVGGALTANQMGYLGQTLPLREYLPIDKLFPAGPVEKVIVLNSNPQGAQISIDGAPRNQVTPWSFPLTGEKGQSFAITLELDGFETKTHDIVMDPEMETELTLPLNIEPISRLITTEPTGARVAINNKEIGQSPIHFDFVPEKTVEIKVNQAGFHEATWSYTEGKDNPSKLAKTLDKVRPPGTVEIQSAMEDLTIIANGKRQRSNFSIPAGTYRVKVSSQRYFYEEEHRVQVDSGGTVRLSTPNLVTIPKIDVIGGYAKVKIDGRFVKKNNQVEYTPITNLKISAGRHVFKFEDDNGNIIKQIEQDVTGEPIIVEGG